MLLRLFSYLYLNYIFHFYLLIYIVYNINMSYVIVYSLLLYIL
jgi:hypothetical protein